MKSKAATIAKIVSVVVLVGFMLNTLLMLGQLKALDSQLSQNEKLLGRAIAYEEAMGVKSGRLKEMEAIFDVVMQKMASATSMAKGIAATADEIKLMNEQLLSANQTIDKVIVDNFAMANEMSSRMSQVVGTMGNAGGLLTAIGSSASKQLAKVAQMYQLACENNAVLPSLP
ncbi:MAG: hypothetical protein ACYC99_04305 [Candidatus Geothermincolia bacterium]